MQSITGVNNSRCRETGGTDRITDTDGGMSDEQEQNNQVYSRSVSLV
jgi:hypothetical protein